MKGFGLFYIVLLVLLGHRIYFGNNSLPEYWRMQEKVAWQQKINQKLQLRNQALHREVEDLKHGFEAIEERAREDLGLIKPNETFYRFLPISDSERR